MSSTAEKLRDAFTRFSAPSVDLDLGEELITEGSTGGTVYLLTEGSLEVSHSINGTKAVVALIDEPGSLVGEVTALGGGKRSATVIAAENSSVLSLPEEKFQEVLDGDPDLARDLVRSAVRRIEEGELVDLLAGHFKITDRGLLMRVGSGVSWQDLTQGEVLVREGDPSDSMFFVIRGRLRATRNDMGTGESIEIGMLGRGDAIGEIGLMANEPRMATVTAVRDSVLARLDASTFGDLVEAQPRMAVELGIRAVSRAEDSRWRPTPATVLSLVGTPGLDVAPIAELMTDEIQRFGTVRRLWAGHVDDVLGIEGVSGSEPGAVGDIRVSRVVHEAELEADHLVVELGSTPGPWSRRCLGLSDRVVVFLPPAPSAADLTHVEQMLGGCPTGVARSIAFVHEAKGRPSGSAELADRFFATDVSHVTTAEADIARLARTSVGRANTLVLSGGGGRGFAHMGVLRVLEELGFEVDLVGGTSIGGVIAAVIADGMTSKEIEDWAADHFPKVIDYTLPIVSLTKGQRIAKSAVETFGTRDVEDLWLGYFAVSSDLTAAKPHVHDTGRVATAIRATSAIPGVMPPVPLGEGLLIDGGVLNNLPLDIARQRSPDGLMLAVDVAPPRGPSAHEDYGLSVSGWQALRSRLKRGPSPYPNISAVLMRSMITASMRERDAMVARGLADCYLDLDMRGISMLEFEDPRGVALRGYETAMPQLREWLRST